MEVEQLAPIERKLILEGQKQIHLTMDFMAENSV